MTKQKKYTFMIIPDDEKDSWSFNLSKAVLQLTGFLMISLCIGSLLILVLYFPKLSYHKSVEANYNKLISERLEVLKLSQDLKKIKQMGQMVRNTLGEKLDIDNPISIEDSTLGLYKLPKKSISQLQNIPSHPPINGFIRKHVSNGRNFLRDTHYGHNKKNLKFQLDIVEKGEIIALVGSSGISSGPHLHFEIWREFKPVDPLLYFPEYSYTDLTF